MTQTISTTASGGKKVWVAADRGYGRKGKAHGYNIVQFTLSDLRNLAADADYDDEQPAHIAEALAAFAEANRNYIWQITSDDGSYVEEEFHPTYRSALYSALSQKC